MYYLPFQQQVRFCALKDEPAVEAELKTWTTLDHTWEELLEHPLLSQNIVDGDAVLGVFFKRNGTFVTNGVGLPQILFNGNPRSLLFVYSFYSITGSSNSFAYSKIHPGYFRSEISPHYYSGDEESLEGIWEGLGALREEKANKDDIQFVSKQVELLRSEIDRLRTRSDPAETVLPAMASQSEQVNFKLRDLQQQIDNLQPPDALGIIEYTNHYNKAQINYLLTQFATTGYVDTKLINAATKTEFENHKFDNTNEDHKVTYSQVGAPSRAEFELLLERVQDLQDNIFSIQAQDYISSITGEGGVLATPEGDGEWIVDGSNIPMPFLAVMLNENADQDQAIFSLAGNPDNVTIVFVDGVFIPPDNYTLNGNVLTLDNSLDANQNIVVIAG